MRSPSRQYWWVVLLLLALGIGVVWDVSGDSENEPRPEAKSKRPGRRAKISHRTSRPRYRTLVEWQREVEALFGSHEAGRSRILSRKQTVDSELYLLGVESPTPDEVRRIRARIKDFLSEMAPENRATAEEEIEKLIQEYDPFGDEGSRVIQIDIPDEPNGRLTGFTCQTTDFADITERFVNGEMMDLQNLRGYSASYAGMPLTRFNALIVTDDVEPR